MRYTIIVLAVLALGCTLAQTTTTQHQFDADGAKLLIKMEYGVDLDEVIPPDVWEALSPEARERIIIAAVTPPGVRTVNVELSQTQETATSSEAEIEARVRAQLAKELSEANMGDDPPE